MFHAERRKATRCGRRQACENCRRRKERCDGQRPCSRCRMRDVESQCGSVDMPSPSVPQHLGYGPSTNFGESSFDSHSRLVANDICILRECPGTASVTNGSTIVAPLAQPPVDRNDQQFFQKQQGDCYFVGQSSNVSMLRNLQHLVGDALPPCPFLDESMNSGLVGDDPGEPINLAYDGASAKLPNEIDARYCIRWYTRATTCVFDLFSYDELVEEIIPSLANQSPTPAKSCINLLVLAIGAQCGPRDMESEAHAWFARGRYLAMTHFLEKPLITTVQIFALLAMYQLNSSRRHAASMYLSIAVRAAYALGIHRPGTAALFSATEEKLRERMWKVLRVMDLFLSTTLGLTPATSETRDTGSQRGYSASTDLCYIFEKILRELYERQEVHNSALRDVSKHHRQWATRFHEGLKIDHISAEPFGDDFGSGIPNIGLFHLKEAYYWTIILVSFPYLLELVQDRLANVRHPLPSPAANNAYVGPLPQRETLLAHASVNSAVLTIDLLRGLLQSKDVPKRLPYVVNSVFVSSLVLGASFFADIDCAFPVEENLLTAEKLLELFQQHDPLARQELVIVRSLRNACKNFVNQRHKRWLKHQGYLVQGIFGNMNPLDPDTQASPPASPPSVQLPSYQEGNTHNKSSPPQMHPETPQSNTLLHASHAIWGDLFGNESHIDSTCPAFDQREFATQMLDIGGDTEISLMPFLPSDDVTSQSGSFFK